MDKGSYIVSWSGGKDSCLALYEAMRRGYKVSYILNFISKEFRRVSFHGTEAKLIRLQSEALGIPLSQHETTPDGYEQEFKEAVRSLIPRGIKGIIFGDVYLEEHKEWTEKVCKELGVEAVEPLWGKVPQEVLSDFIDAGFEAVVVSGQSKFIGKKWIGHKVDRDLMEYLKSRNIDILGENGEYHTLVTDGPIFEKKIKITEARTIKRKDFWFLDTRRYQIGEGRS